MVTRRTAIGAGLAFGSVAWAAGFGVYGATVQGRSEARSVDVLLIDDSLEMSGQMAAFIQAGRRALPVVGFQLDAAGHAGLMRVLNKSQAIAGISSGATLFCLERIAWDHGFRLTGRSEGYASDPGDDAFRQDVVVFISGTEPAAASASPLARAYRPSRADGMLHAWIMQKSGPQLRQHRREA
jgi:hypothetical protein